MLRTALVTLLVLVLSGCTGAKGSEDDDSKAAQARPELGACRTLEPADIRRSSDTSDPVPCTDKHTAETFAVGTFPKELTAADTPQDKKLGAYVYTACQKKFESFLGGDDSLVLRSTLSWVWFRAPKAAWAKGAHWWRCDVVGGGEQSRSFVALPKTAKGVLLGKADDRWQVCVNGASVSGSAKIPCSQRHSWRAVTTIVLGKAGDSYPGDRLVEVRTRDFCSDSVGAWLNYPVDYDYGFTWFHEAEWQAGNRRSICWAKTKQ